MSNLILLPKMIPDIDCRDLVKWIDSLTIAELQELKKLWDAKKKESNEM